jgi:hypothetical protein
VALCRTKSTVAYFGSQSETLAVTVNSCAKFTQIVSRVRFRWSVSSDLLSSFCTGSSFKYKEASRAVAKSISIEIKKDVPLWSLAFTSEPILTPIKHGFDLASWKFRWQASLLSNNRLRLGLEKALCGYFSCLLMRSQNFILLLCVCFAFLPSVDSTLSKADKSAKKKDKPAKVRHFLFCYRS